MWSTLAYNGFVQGWIPTPADYERPRKYVVTEHAERRAIYRAAKHGVLLEGATLYATWAACAVTFRPAPELVSDQHLCAAGMSTRDGLR